MHGANTRRITCDRQTWTVTRDTGVRAGASNEGYYPPPGRRGLHFVSDGGEHRVLDCGLDDLPGEEAFRSLPDTELCSLLAKAKTAA